LIDIVFEDSDRNEVIRFNEDIRE